MSRVMSFRDLLLVPALSHLNEIEMLYPYNDSLINSVLDQLGFNINAAILYVPANHRDIRNKTGVGFRAVGEITQDRSFLNSSLCTPVDRAISASFSDMSLAKEMAKLMGSSAVDFRNTAVDGALDDYEPGASREYLEDDYEEVTSNISFLEHLRDDIRGTPYNSYGNLKTPKEYAEDQ